jgi:hypothetical protein
MRQPLHSRTRKEGGVALLIVLACIVLLTILIISFISFTRLNRLSTAGYVQSIRAQEIAEGGLQDILSDFHQEIVAGSTLQNGGTGTYVPVYVPTTNLTAQPARLGYPSTDYGPDVSSTQLPPTLVRVSRASQDGTPTDLYPTPSAAYNASQLPSNRASNANSSTLSVNGRYVSAAVWNHVSLLTTNSTIPPPFASDTPDWVYVTRAGSYAATKVQNLLPAPLNNTQTVAGNASPAVGRYAYAVYDEGALLNVNAAGYISSAGSSAAYSANTLATPTANNPANIAQRINNKSYLVSADLTQLPGLNASGAQTIVDNFIKWRNASTNLSTGANFFQTVFTASLNGFLNFQTTAVGSDSPLLSRQDLINYFAQLDPSGTSYAQAVPYLGTFSRALNAPSWNPSADSPNLPGYYGLSSKVASYTFTSSNFGNVLYKTNAETSTMTWAGATVPNPNRDIPNVRYPASTPANTPIIHYNDDGTQYTYYVNPGDPVVQHRFSLAKLAWLNESAANGINTTAFNPSLSTAQQQAAIQACFGLQWDPQNFAPSVAHYDRWDYVANATGPVAIMTLNQVANGATPQNAGGPTLPREPNFFEMLKAGILNGSLGQSPGPQATTSAEGPIALGLEYFNVEKNRHILQIGANIIDQFDSDSIPTAIYLGLFGAVPPATSLTTEDDLAFNTVYGDENLPGLDHIALQTVEDWYAKVGLNARGTWKTWIVPEIWNIHQPPAANIDTANSGTPGYPRPTHFRVHAYGKIVCQDSTDFNPNGTSDTPIDYDYPSTTPAYPYQDSSSGPLIQSVPPSLKPATIAGSQSPATAYSGFAVPTSNKMADETSPADLIYFTDQTNAQSPFYRCPATLQCSNLYSNGPASFAGTNPLNLAVKPYDTQLVGDNNSGTQFAALFAGEDPTFPNMIGYASHIDYSFSASNPLYVSLECQDPTTTSLKWHPYNFISRLGGSSIKVIIGDNTSATSTNYNGMPGSPGSCAANGQTYLGGRGGIAARPDPRTDRFSVMIGRVAQDMGGQINTSLNPNPTTTHFLEDYFPWRTWGFVYNPDQGPNPTGNGSGGAADSYVAAWAVNSTAGTAYYVDPDGVVRPADGYRENTATGDGALLYHGTGSYGYQAIFNSPDTTSVATSPASLLPTTSSASPTGSAQARRPVILNRPFRNVGELGYAFRDLPFKTIDFFSKSSADGALLDLFSITDEPPISAAQINLSNAPASVLTAILAGSAKMEINDPTDNSANFMSQSEAGTVAAALASGLQSQPLSSRADLVKVLDPILTSEAATNPNYGNKAFAEAPVRALSDISNTRTWNLLIDIIAQAGQMSPTASTLNDFVVTGERRYWLHVAIDRYTGKIVDQQLEPVYE